jgi:hypothetical protein
VSDGGFHRRNFLKEIDEQEMNHVAKCSLKYKFAICILENNRVRSGEKTSALSRVHLPEQPSVVECHLTLTVANINHTNKLNLATNPKDIFQPCSGIEMRELRIRNRGHVVACGVLKLCYPSHPLHTLSSCHTDAASPAVPNSALLAICPHPAI